MVYDTKRKGKENLKSNQLLLTFLCACMCANLPVQRSYQSLYGVLQMIFVQIYLCFLLFQTITVLDWFSIGSQNLSLFGKFSNVQIKPYLMCGVRYCAESSLYMYWLYVVCVRKAMNLWLIVLMKLFQVDINYHWTSLVIYFPCGNLSFI